MGWLDKLFHKKDEGDEAPKGKAGPETKDSTIVPFAGLEGFRFGRYSDNNKTYQKTKSWYTAEDRFKEKNYGEAFDALFDYIRDEDENNLIYRPDGRSFTFEFTQGSKRVYGESDGTRIVARAPMAVMTQPSTAVMRRLLELNYTLYYTRTAMTEDNTLSMLFDTEVSTASPNKMYYGLRELATKADRQDDLLLADFSTALQPTDVAHLQPLSATELDIKYRYFRQWIEQTLARAAELNQDSFSGAIAYLLLRLIYRIDFLITPEAKLLADIEKINALYWEKKDEVSLIERNKLMTDAIRKLLDVSRDDFAKSLYRSKSTFAVAVPSKMDKVKETITSSNKDAAWYVENKYPDLALALNEYAMVYNPFAFSMPRVLLDLVTIYMAVMQSAFFNELGMQRPFYNEANNTFDKEAIEAAISKTIKRHRDKYTQLKWDYNEVKYTNRYDFGMSFSEELAHLNMEVKKMGA